MNFRNWFVAVAALSLLNGCAHNPASAPGSGGLSAERLQQFDAAVRADVDKGLIPGAVMLVARDGKVVHSLAYGKQDPGAGSAMAPDSIFRIYSMTKPIVSVAAMILVEEGRMQLADPVAKYIPELKDLKVGVEKGGSLELVSAQRPITIQDLMRHTSGLTYGVFGKSLVKDLYTKNGVDSVDHTNAEFVKKLATVPLAYQPGSTWEYSRSTDVLGHVVERVSGQTLDRFLEERILKPLGMRDTAFFVEPAKHTRIAEAFAKEPGQSAPTSMLKVREKPKYLAGGQGLVSTAGDYLRFAQMMLNGGELDGVRIVSKKTVEYMTSDHLGGVRGPAYLPGPGYGFGLGVKVRTSAGEADSPGSPGDYDWGGAGGTYFWVDPKERLIGVWMMQAPANRVHYRRLMRAMVYGAITQ
jgi:CubicO group peptidase (beta-lactamase class C family)